MCRTNEFDLKLFYEQHILNYQLPQQQHIWWNSVILMKDNLSISISFVNLSQALEYLSFKWHKLLGDLTTEEPTALCLILRKRWRREIICLFYCCGLKDFVPFTHTLICQDRLILLIVRLMNRRFTECECKLARVKKRGGTVREWEVSGSDSSVRERCAQRDWVK